MSIHCLQMWNGCRSATTLLGRTLMLLLLWSGINQIVCAQTDQLARVARELSDEESPGPSSPSPDDDPVVAELQFNQGVYNHIRGHHTKALEELQATSTAASYYRGILLLEMGRVEEANQLMGSLQAESEAPAEASLYLGLGRLHDGDAVGAETALQRYLEVHPGDTYGNYLLGVALAHQDRVDESLEQLTQAGVDPETINQFRLAGHSDANEFASSESERSSRTAQDHQSRWLVDPAASYEDPSRRWNFTLLFAFEYDSNVALAPQFVGLGSIAQPSDSRVLVASFGDFLAIDRPDFNLGVVWSTFDTFHFDLDEFNLHDYMGGFYSNVALGNMLGSLRYEYHQTLLDDTHFASTHRVTPSLSYVGCDWGHTTLYYEFEDVAIDVPALIPALEQSASIQSVGFTQAFYTFGGAGRFYLGYRYDNASAQGSDFDRYSHMITARIERPLGCDWMFDIEGRHFWDNYKNPNSLDFFNRPRQDTRVAFRTGLQKYLHSNWTLRFDYTYMTTNSNVTNLFNVAFYEYDRHVLSTQIIYDF